MLVCQQHESYMFDMVDDSDHDPPDRHEHAS